MDERLRRCIDTHLAPWMAEIERYRNLIGSNKEVVPGISNSTVSAHLDRAESVCNALKKGDVGIESNFRETTKDRYELLREAIAARESMYRVSLSALFDHSSLPCRNLNLGQMMAWLSREPLDVPWGVHVQDWGTISDPIAHTSSLFEHLDGLYRDDKNEHEGSNFKGLPLEATPFSERFNLLFNRAMEAVALEGLFSTWGPNFDSVRAAVWRQQRFPTMRRRKGREARTHVAIPSRNRSMKFYLRASPMLCQVYEHNRKHWDVDDCNGLSFVNVRVGDIQEKRVNGQTFRHGRTPMHIYLTVLIQRFGHSLGQAQMERRMGTTENHAEKFDGLPDDLARNLITGQYKPCSVLIALDKGELSPPYPSRPIAWFSSTGANAESCGGALQWPEDVTYLAARHVDAKPAENGTSAPEELGTIHIPWNILGEQVDWLDTTLIARRNGHWSVIPAMIIEQPCPDSEDEASTDGDCEPMLVVLSPDLAGDWPVSRLRKALSRATWAYQCRGSAAFLAGALDLDKV